ncbi:hypothetical protein SynRS9909_02632 [Synechococcus sp. RS9909]|nr:hypothetical protein SynRS9909_02632 [Synechococcus sp. RS9909]
MDRPTKKESAATSFFLPTYSYSEIDTGAAVFQFTRFNGQPEVIRCGDFSS